MPSKAKLFGALIDMQDNIVRAQRFTSGVTFEEFAESDLHFYATMKAIEIVCEVVRKRLPEEVKNRHPHLPWQKISATGNIYRHEYDKVSERRVWEAVQVYMPPLLEVVKAELAALEKPAAARDGPADDFEAWIRGDGRSPLDKTPIGKNRLNWTMIWACKRRSYVRVPTRPLAQTSQKGAEAPLTCSALAGSGHSRERRK